MRRPYGVKRILLFATTTGYQVRMFGEAAERLGVQLIFATDRCDQLDDPWWDGAIPVRFHDDESAVEAMLSASERAKVDGILAVGDRPTVAAAYAAQHLGLPGNSPEAAKAARDKRRTRERLRDAGLPVPDCGVFSRHLAASEIAQPWSWPVVVKPAVLSGSRGVIRADNHGGFVAAFERVQRLLEAVDIRALRDPAADQILVEAFIPGREYALEGLLDNGRLQTLAIFDKPDPLDGPLFEETIYVTPSLAGEPTQQSIRAAVVAAIAALGLHHGPIHAECRVNERGVYVLEVAARPIGGLCARALRFVGGGRVGRVEPASPKLGVASNRAKAGRVASLEELLLRHALGEPVEAWHREANASGVMMIPIPSAGIYRRVHGVEDARQVRGIDDLQITAKPDQTLVPLPEGASYLGFIFARAEHPEDVEHALREAHACLTFVIERSLPVVTASSPTAR